MWKDIFDCDADSDRVCRERTLNLSEFQIDSKVDFVVDSVLLFSEALDRLDEDAMMGRLTPVNSFDFFWKYILKSEYNGRLFNIVVRKSIRCSPIEICGVP